MTKILNVVIKRKWFNQIKACRKKEEYREIKPYWDKRLMTNGVYNQFDQILFRNGYHESAEVILAQCWQITKGWSPVFQKETYIISIGRILRKDLTFAELKISQQIKRLLD